MTERLSLTPGSVALVVCNAGVLGLGLGFIQRHSDVFYFSDIVVVILL